MKRRAFNLFHDGPQPWALIHVSPGDALSLVRSIPLIVNRSTLPMLHEALKHYTKEVDRLSDVATQAADAGDVIGFASAMVDANGAQHAAVMVLRWLAMMN